MTIDVRRHGMKSSHSGIAKDIDEARLCVEHGIVNLTFVSNKGGENESMFDLWVRPESYANLAKAMMLANPDAAIRAFGAALEPGRNEPVERWRPKCPSNECVK